jgi:hypothetical protein
LQDFLGGEFRMITNKKKEEKGGPAAVAATSGVMPTRNETAKKVETSGFSFCSIL